MIAFASAQYETELVYRIPFAAWVKGARASRGMRVDEGRILILV